ncbi:sporulation protein SsgA [Streptomyces violaceoruber]|uniref:Sporulation protein SsgA n=1 Tax=Streptomyces violaceoruber TaxID=1935 RepID=A0A1V0UEZ2_STRVN|nr:MULTISPECIES: plasmid transfer protein TraA [Streptomyces]ARF63650.1 sporulation protein SsgA [Streptomyces violaceoruber]KOU47916.1 sporulation protein SsgA [Streptomyces sp. MMG1522]
MASNSSSSRQAQRPSTPPPRQGGSDKGEKFAGSVGAAAGGFVGAMGGSFVPPINLTINNSSKVSKNAAPPNTGAQGLLPAPEFSSPAQIRDYCNTLRAAAVMLSFEVAMGAEILKAVLGTVPDPEGRMGASKRRAFKVSRKMQRAADELRNAAKLAAACYAQFQQEFEGELNAHRHRARPAPQPRMNWGQQ